MDAQMTVQEARTEAALVLREGQKLAEKARARTLTPKQRGRLCSEVLGGVLTKPGEFWGAACLIESGGDVTGGESIALGVRYACARMAVGDLSFVRESLVGQAQWASVLAVKLAAQGEAIDNVDRAAVVYKLAMQAQRQAAQALATAAALNKLTDADSVSVS
jgi:hypothetical protein